MLSLAINYQVSGLDGLVVSYIKPVMVSYQLLLCISFGLLLSNKNVLISFTRAILFSIHPMHVESVASISERKDVLYGLFFLAGLISYTKYADVGSKKQYGPSCF